MRGLSSPASLGAAALTAAVAGSLSAAKSNIEPTADTYRVHQATATSGDGGQSSTTLLERSAAVSRDARRDAVSRGADRDLLEQAEAQAQERNLALGRMSKLAERQSAWLAENLWVLPLGAVQVTAEFGAYGLWSSSHTGIDFNGDTGDPIRSVANGVVSSAQSDGAYGNKTVVTLPDGTEIWYCHQNGFTVMAGEAVEAGEVIGYVGSTGNVTGSHLHLEVRPGGGDPVDPRAAFRVHGVEL